MDLAQSNEGFLFFLNSLIVTIFNHSLNSILVVLGDFVALLLTVLKYLPSLGSLGQEDSGEQAPLQITV